MPRGIVRKIDDLGRIVIPIEIRRVAGVINRDMLSLCLVNGVVRLSKGEGRKLDELGRYVVPKEIRDSYGWKIGQAMDIYLEGEEICIRKFGCEWCDETEDLLKIHGHRICRKCASKIIETYTEGRL